MALTVSVLDPQPVAEYRGQKAFVRARVTFDTSYVTGGMALTAANLGLSTIDSLVVIPSTPQTATSNVYVTWSRTAGTLMAFTSNGAAAALLLEFTSTGSLSTLQVEVLAYGKV